MCYLSISGVAWGGRGPSPRHKILRGTIFCSRKNQKPPACASLTSLPFASPVCTSLSALLPPGQFHCLGSCLVLYMLTNRGPDVFVWATPAIIRDARSPHPRPALGSEQGCWAYCHCPGELKITWAAAVKFQVPSLFPGLGSEPGSEPQGHLVLGTFTVVDLVLK